MRQTIATLGCLLFCTTLLGCSTAPAEQPQSARLTFSADRYPAVFEAAVEVLRDNGYRIARRDYRFGTITTFPKEAGTTAEFWIDDATTRGQKRADTLNSQQRTVTALVEQLEADQGYSLAVEVRVQRLQRPERYLTHSASPRISTTYTDVPMHLKDRGIDGPYAQSLDRDPLLERRLLEAIKVATPPATDTSNKAFDPIDIGEPLTPAMRLKLARALREDAHNAGLKERHALLAEANDLLVGIAKGNPDRLQFQIEYAQALLDLASHDSLTKRQKEHDKELVTLNRFQRGQDFNKLFDLIDRLVEDFPNDDSIQTLQKQAQSALARFENADIIQ